MHSLAYVAKFTGLKQSDKYTDTYFKYLFYLC
jgi:hypothetical protein